MWLKSGIPAQQPQSSSHGTGKPMSMTGMIWRQRVGVESQQTLMCLLKGVGWKVQGNEGGGEEVALGWQRRVASRATLVLF